MDRAPDSTVHVPTSEPYFRCQGQVPIQYLVRTHSTGKKKKKRLLRDTYTYGLVVLRYILKASRQSSVTVNPRTNCPQGC